MEENIELDQNQTLKIAKRPAVDIEFQDLGYKVPQGRKGSKLILRNINGKFSSGELTAILGPSGSGKSTLLNVLAGYKCREATGTILVNGEPRDMKEFRQMARYIMQEDLIQPLLSVQEAMMLAANLKLSKSKTEQDKIEEINEILTLLRLSHTTSTATERLSGGEKKRLSIALELLNNPPVLFLDEPTTGLDDLSCTQCVSLLKQLAEGGRTVICSIHTPSAKLFAMFDNVYVISSGQCTYQGYGPDIVSYSSTLGIICPTHYNPADFMLELCCGEYGECWQEKMVSAIDNGRNQYSQDKFTQICDIKTKRSRIEPFVSIVSENRNSEWDQFKIILGRMWIQMFRNRCYLWLKIILHLLLGVLVGNLYFGFGRDGSKTIFNFGFYFNCMIFFMYVPMMPVLLSFPLEIQYIKREHFNRWYKIRPYFCALSVATIPVQVVLGTFYLSIVYILSEQPLEISRIIPFYCICFLTSIISESFGLLVSSTLNLVNGMFIAPTMLVPFMVLAAYGFGEGYANIPILIKIVMHFSYLRYSMEGLVLVMFRGRARLPCPDNEDMCIFTDLDKFIEVMAMNNAILWVDIVALFTFLVVVRGASYYLLRQRLMPNKTFMALQYIIRFIKTRLSEGQ